MVAYLHNILLPYIIKAREELKLTNTHPCLVIFDQFKVGLSNNIDCKHIVIKICYRDNL